jgi:hypothetical protein
MCSFSYTSWEEVCEPNSMNITVHFHFSICSFVFAICSFMLSFSLYSQDLRSSVLNADGSLTQTFITGQISSREHELHPGNITRGGHRKY